MSADSCELRIVIDDVKQAGIGKDTHTIYRVKALDISGCELGHHWLRFSLMYDCFEKMKQLSAQLPALPRQYPMRKVSGNAGLIEERRKTCEHFLNCAAACKTCRRSEHFCKLVKHTQGAAEEEPCQLTPDTQRSLASFVETAAAATTSSVDTPSPTGIPSKDDKSLTSSTRDVTEKGCPTSISDTSDREASSAGSYVLLESSRDEDVALKSAVAQQEGDEVHTSQNSESIVGSESLPTASQCQVSGLLEDGRADIFQDQRTIVRILNAVAMRRDVACLIGLSATMLAFIVRIVRRIRTKSQTNLRSAVVFTGFVLGFFARRSFRRQLTCGQAYLFKDDQQPAIGSDSTMPQNPQQLPISDAADSQSTCTPVCLTIAFDSETIDAETPQISTSASKPTLGSCFTHEDIRALLDRLRLECTCCEGFLSVADLGIGDSAAHTPIRLQRKLGANTFRATATLQGTCQDIMEVLEGSLDNVAAARHLQPEIASIRVLERFGEDASFIHFEFLYPGRTQLCDIFVVHATQRLENGGVLSVFETLDDSCVSGAGAKLQSPGKLTLAFHVVPRDDRSIVLTVLRFMEPAGGCTSLERDVVGPVSLAEYFAKQDIQNLKVAMQARSDGQRLCKSASECSVQSHIWKAATRNLLAEFSAATQSSSGWTVAKQIFVGPLGRSVPLQCHLVGVTPAGTWRAEAEINGSLDDFVSMVNRMKKDIDLAKRIAPDLLEQNVLGTINTSTSVLRKIDKFPWPLWNRDYIFLSAIGFAPDGSFYVASRSVPHGIPGSSDYIPETPTKPKEVGKLVRGHLELAGFRARPIPGSDPPRISLMQFVNASAGGAVPTVAFVKAMEQRAHVLGRVQQELSRIVEAKGR